MTSKKQMYFCQQCSRLDWRERKTKKFCSEKCKQSHKRGNEPIPYWEKDEQSEIDKYERFIQEILVAGRRDVAAQLQRVKDKYGLKAMYMMIDTLRMVIE